MDVITRFESYIRTLRELFLAAQAEFQDFKFYLNTVLQELRDDLVTIRN